MTERVSLLAPRRLLSACRVQLDQKLGIAIMSEPPTLRKMTYAIGRSAAQLPLEQAS